MNFYVLRHISRILALFSLFHVFTAAYAQPTDNSSLDVVILGDSNTWIGGDDCAGEKGWPLWFVRKFRPASCRSYARSGATWTNTSATVRDIAAYTEILDDNNVIYNQIERLIAAVANDSQPSPEIIMIAAGTNDAWFEKRRPGIFAQSVGEAFADDKKLTAVIKPAHVTSLAGSIRFGCELLMQKFPDAQIVLLTSPQITQCPYEIQQRVNDTITECARRLSLSVIPLDSGNGTYRIHENVERRNTSDGAHTSVRGARRTGCFVASQLQSILLF